ncbi:hypothetical protein PS2_011372 [Malus domestica]
MPSQQQFVMDLTTMPSLAPHNQAQQPPQATTFSSHHEATDLDASSTALGLAPTSPLPDHYDGVSPNPRTHMSTDEPSPSTALTPTNDADVLDQAHSPDHQKFKSVNNIIYGSTPHPLPQALTAALNDPMSFEPSSHTQVAKYLHWQKAMTEEYEALLSKPNMVSCSRYYLYEYCWMQMGLSDETQSRWFY